MYNNQIFERNLLSLSLHNKQTAAELSRSQVSSSLCFKKAKNGSLVPILNHDSRDYSLHSLFDPDKEGSRYCATVKGGGYVVVFGIGAFYHIRCLLDRNDINGLLLIDKDLPILKSVLSNIDLSELLSDSRISILIDRKAEEIIKYLPSNYLPAVTGDFQTLSLRSRVESEKEYFHSIMDSIKGVMGTLSDDYTVQTWFGKRWFINSIANLDSAQKSTAVLSPRKKILVAAAGPSLELQLSDIVKNRDKGYLISTDTALSCLLKNNIIPDLVISIDCQQITYHHFMAGYPKDIPLVLDLASPPALSRLSEKTFFFTSGHPFSQYVNRNWRRFPFVDTSGGNVTHAALSLSDSLGASEIFLYGADYSYPEGKSYARGTYIYPYFLKSSFRNNPSETMFYNFLYRNKNIKMLKTDYGFRYTTRPMLSYKERLEKYAAEVSGQILPVKGLGETINIPPSKPKLNSDKMIIAAGKSRTDWKEFLYSYKNRLLQLPEPEDPPVVYLSNLDLSDKDIWTTLFPIAAVLRKKYRDKNIKSSEILKEVRTWALEVIDLFLDAKR